MFLCQPQLIRAATFASKLPLCVCVSSLFVFLFRWLRVCVCAFSFLHSMVLLVLKDDFELLFYPFVPSFQFCFECKTPRRFFWTTQKEFWTLHTDETSWILYLHTKHMVCVYFGTKHNWHFFQKVHTSSQEQSPTHLHTYTLFFLHFAIFSSSSKELTQHKETITATQLQLFPIWSSQDNLLAKPTKNIFVKKGLSVQKL